MDVFISWSGERAHRVGELLKSWLQTTLQATKPWLSSEDIAKGVPWFIELKERLGESPVGVVCLTAENQHNPWVLFEAGAIFKGADQSKVCTLLVDLEVAEISGPLAQFNHTSPDRDGMYTLLNTLNSALGERALAQSVLDESFERGWSEFEVEFAALLLETSPTVVPDARSAADMAEETLKIVRRLDKQLMSNTRYAFPRGGSLKLGPENMQLDPETVAKITLFDRDLKGLFIDPVRGKIVRDDDQPDSEGSDS